MNLSLHETLGWTLLHSLWQGTLVAFLVLLIRRWLAPSARTHYLLLVGSLTLVLVSALGTFLYLWPTADAPVAQAATTPTLAIPLVEMYQVTAPAPAEPVWFVTWINSLKSCFPWLAWAWLIGVAVLSLRFAGGLAWTYRLRRRALQAASSQWTQALHRLVPRMQIRRSVRVFESSLVHIPMVLGYFKPIILVPIGLVNGLSPAQVEAILAHELAHIRRYDYLINLFQSFVEILMFYHPAVWWLSREIRNEREHCCDDWAVTACDDSLSLAKALLHLQEWTATVPSTALAFTGPRFHVLARIRRLVQPEAHAPRFPAAEGSVALLVVLLALVVGWQQKAPHTGRQSMVYSAATLPNLLFQHWLPQDASSDAAPTEPTVASFNTISGKASVVTAAAPAVPLPVTLVSHADTSKSSKQDRTSVTITDRDENGKRKRIKAELEDDELVELRINGRKIPEKYYQEHQRELDQIFRQLRRGTSTAPRVYVASSRGGVSALHVTPPSPVAPMAHTETMTILSDLASLGEFDLVAPLPDFEVVMPAPLAFTAPMTAPLAIAVPPFPPDSLDSLRWNHEAFAEHMQEWQEEFRQSQEAWREQWEVYREELQEHQHEWQEKVDEYREQVRELREQYQEEMRGYQDKVRAEQEKLRAQQRDHFREQRALAQAYAGDVVLNEKVIDAFEDAFVEDELIEDRDRYSFEMSPERLVVNGTSQPREVLEKYLDLYEKLVGKRLRGNFNYMFSK
ncbi:Signal transducer regulating beta-lactamase production, contains metallopeptidase domain [Catalinimonas alkaloidigena]|uniref:Signal transducer regulating beta-lactamase production, contains metallopeptidase domain n=1 Tax=Catalinimonas alkaloidigena TaxID=1075417 RepID=A0A1G9BFW3_9BACT|nr:M56 family metallopeptidase [Catalinimonas alkaloidigena]SDK38080.1 Signal transducer regulating beta-lactamase production, contains metallopeptidase domain [Catalinimonas alkaloidigena]